MWRLATAFAFVLCAAAFGGGEASAHSDDGLLSVEAQSAQGTNEVDVRTRLTYANDGDLASGATVTVEGIGPAGELLAPQPLVEGQAGFYAGMVTLPAAGTWKLRVVATTPAATAEIGFTTVEPGGTTTTLDVQETVPVPESTSSSADGGNDWILPGAVLLIVLILGGGMAALHRQRAARGA